MPHADEGTLPDMKGFFRKSGMTHIPAQDPDNRAVVGK
jgi:hypothetical protein